MKIRKLNILSFVLILCVISQTMAQSKIPILDQQIGQSIFHESKLYIIYVTDTVNDDVLEIFQGYCKEENKLCTILSPQVDRYKDFRSFLGVQKDQFFCILDVKNRKKYVLPIYKQLKTKDIEEFQIKFRKGQLESYMASQQPDKISNEKCRRVVSKNLNDFLNNEAQIKVLFLYTKHQACEVCQQMLKGYKQIAQRVYDKQIVVFGYYDIFKNDHPRITDQILPYFLFFTKESQEPFGLQGDKFHELQQTIIQIALKNTDIDLDAFRRQHMMNLLNNQKPVEQHQLNYNTKQHKKEVSENLQQL